MYYIHIHIYIKYIYIFVIASWNSKHSPDKWGPTVRRSTTSFRGVSFLSRTEWVWNNCQAFSGVHLTYPSDFAKDTHYSCPSRSRNVWTTCWSAWWQDPPGLCRMQDPWNHRFCFRLLPNFSSHGETSISNLVRRMASNQKNAGRTSPTTSGCRDSFTAGSGAGKLPTQRGAISPMTQRRWLRWERHTRHKDWLRKPHGRWHWTLTRCGELGTNLQAKSYTKDVAKGMRMMIVSCLQRMSWASGWKPCSKWWKGRCREGWVEPTNRRSERLWPGQIMSRVAELAWLPSVPLGEMGNSVLSEFAWLQDRSGLPWSLISMLHTTVMSSFSNPAPNPILMNAETTLLYLRNLIGPATLSKDSDHIYICIYIYVYIYVYIYIDR